jgi:hypothetical protein
MWKKRDGQSVRAVWMVVCLGMCLALEASCWGYNPESPEVKRMVDRALKFLETSKHGTVGGTTLIGLAFFKAGADLDHPKVAEAIKQATQLARQVRESGVGSHCYNEAFACIFLCEVGPDRYREEIEHFVYGFAKRQTSEGMWTYQSGNQPDTSQTQLVLLALWSAHINGVFVPPDSIENGMVWLLRTQFRDGSFCYWPAPGPPEGARSATAAEPTLSMTVAGLGALYAGVSLLGISRQPSRDPNLPPALQQVPKNQPDKQLSQQFTTAQLLNSCSLGDAWVQRNLRPENSDHRWTYYYLYGLERYMSLKEFVDGKTDESPAWYNMVVNYLQRVQRDSGAWTVGSQNTGEVVDTAFGVLFLLRSMQKTMKRSFSASGILIGGHGLPKNLTNVRLQDGQVVTPQMVRDVDDLLDLLKNTDDMEFDARHLPGGLSLDEDLTKRTSQLERLRELVTDEDFHARYAAVKTLAGSDDLDNIPALIYALTDGDRRIVHEANNGLRFISRKFLANPLPSEPTIEQKWGVQAKWKAWLLSIRPDAEFLD